MFELKIFWNAALMGTQAALLVGLAALVLFSGAPEVMTFAKVALGLDALVIVFLLARDADIEMEVIEGEEKSKTPPPVKEKKPELDKPLKQVQKPSKPVPPKPPAPKGDSGEDSSKAMEKFKNAIVEPSGNAAPSSPKVSVPPVPPVPPVPSTTSQRMSPAQRKKLKDMEAPQGQQEAVQPVPVVTKPLATPGTSSGKVNVADLTSDDWCDALDYNE